MRRIGIFCGSSAGRRIVYADAARQLGALLVERGVGLVFGAGHVGLMGVLADAALQAGGEVIGVIPQALVDRELAHSGLTALHVVNTMHERKALIADLSDAFIGLAGGYGTADELFEVLTWAQLGLHTKPIGLLNTAGFFDPLLEWIDRTIEEKFVRPVHRGLLIDAGQPKELLDRLTNYQPPAEEPKWIEGPDR